METKRQGRRAGGGVWRILAVFVLTLSSPLYAQNPVPTPKPVMQFGFGEAIQAAYSPSGKVIATLSDLGVVVRDAGSGQALRILSEFQSAPTCFAFSPDDTTLAIGMKDGSARTWDLRSGQPLRSYVSNGPPVTTLAFSVDGKRLLVTFRLWDLDNGAEIWHLAPSSTTVAAFSPDGRRFATGSAEGRVQIWNASSLTESFTFYIWTEVTGLSFSPDGRRVAALGNYDYLLGDVESGQVLVQKQLTFYGRGLDFSPDGKWLVTGGGTARFFSPETGAVQRAFSTPALGVRSAQFSPDGKKVVGCNASECIVWDAETGAELRRVSDYSAEPVTVAHDQKNQRVAIVAKDYTISICSAITGQTIRRIVAPTYYAPDAITFSSDGSRLFTDRNGDDQICVWSPVAGYLLSTIPLPRRYAILDFHPEGPLALAKDSEGSVFLWDGSTNSERTILTGDYGIIVGGSISIAANRIITGERDMTVRLWDAVSGVQLSQWSAGEGHWYFGGDLDISQDGQRAITGVWTGQESEEGGAVVRNLPSGEPVRTISSSPYGVGFCRFSPDGWRALVETYYDFNLWNLATGTQIWKAPWKTGVRAIFTSDGRRVLIPSRQNKTYLFDAGSSRGQADKILIVAGGGPGPGNPIAGQVKHLADLAYSVALVRGYRAGEIRYLSSVEDTAANARVFGAATTNAVDDAVFRWGADARRLIVFLLGPGSRDDAGTPDVWEDDEWFFQVGADESFSAGHFRESLDIAQASPDAVGELVVVIDAPFAGGFVTRCAGTPNPDVRRILIASTLPDGTASFSGPDGRLSFTSAFLSMALRGRTLYQCYERGWQSLRAFRARGEAFQVPCIDDDGDGVCTSRDGAAAREIVLGNLPAFGLDPPRILYARTNLDFAEAEDVPLWVTLAESPRPDSVFAVVANAPEGDPVADPIVDHLWIPMSRPASGMPWRGDIPAAALGREGRYAITYVAARKDPLDDSFEYLAAPFARSLWVGVDGRQLVMDYLLGLVDEAPDRNEDGSIDAADLLVP